MTAAELRQKFEQILEPAIDPRAPYAKVMIERLVRAALEAQWRDIEEEQPPQDEMFIYLQRRAGKRSVGLAYHAVSGGWRDSEGDWSTRLAPTHWMPLPKELP